MTRFWFLRVHRDVCRQNEALHRDIREMAFTLNETRRERDEAMDLVVDLRAELDASERLNRVLMEWCPTDLREVDG